MADQTHNPDREQQGKDVSGQAQNGPDEVGKPSPERPYEMKGPEADQVRVMHPGPGSPGFRGPAPNVQRNQEHGRDNRATAEKYANIEEAKITDQEKVREGQRGDLSQEFQKETNPRDR